MSAEGHYALLIGRVTDAFPAIRMRAWVLVVSRILV